MDKLVRRESSVPVQGRISIIDLANMDRYWAVKEGINIKSMSQLLSWTFTAMCDVIKSNGKMPDDIESVTDAHRYLKSRGLYQQSLRKRSQSRLVAAMGFENLRDQGLMPEDCNPRMYNTIHSKHSAEPFNEEVSVGQQDAPSKEEVLEMVRKVRENKAKSMNYKEKELNEARNSNMVTTEDGGVTLKEGMSDEELSEYNKKRDEERIKLERKPINVKDFDLVEET